jgi:uncharacterized protein YciI
MWYFIHATDHPDSLARRLEARPRHLARMQELLDQGRVLVAGPLPAIDSPDPGPAGFSGSVLILEFSSLDEARSWAEADPYVEAGVYARVDVYPFKQALP